VIFRYLVCLFLGGIVGRVLAVTAVVAAAYLAGLPEIAAYAAGLLAATVVFDVGRRTGRS
jgi:hypothetical protein